jgi:hypothetical protein
MAIIVVAFLRTKIGINAIFPLSKNNHLHVDPKYISYLHCIISNDAI